MPVLNEDVNSNFKSIGNYGKKGDKVTVISQSDKVLIVEDKKGKRFPVHENKLIK